MRKRLPRMEMGGSYMNDMDRKLISTQQDLGLQDLMNAFGVWIKGAIKKPGALRATAKRAGAMKKDGTIKKSWLQQQAKKGNSKTAQRARLALTLGKMKQR
jgi:hypothetical protein